MNIFCGAHVTRWIAVSIERQEEALFKLLPAASSFFTRETTDTRGKAAGRGAVQQRENKAAVSFNL